MVSLYTMTTTSPGRVDPLDAALIELLAAEPRVGVLEASRRLRVARGTVQARLERLQDRGVITGYGPEVDPAALGYEVTAFVTLEIRQAGGHDPVAERLAAIPEVLEVHTITGAGDMLCRVVARSNADLQRVIDAIVSADGVVRSATLISLATQVPYRVLPLVRAAAAVGSADQVGGHLQDDGPELVPVVHLLQEEHAGRAHGEHGGGGAHPVAQRSFGPTSTSTSASSRTRTRANRSLPASMDCTEARFCSRKRKTSLLASTMLT